MLSNQGTKMTYSTHRKLILRIKNISLSLYVDLTAYYPEAARTYKYYIYSLNSLITSTCNTSLSAIKTVTRLRSFDCSFVRSLTHSSVHSFSHCCLYIYFVCVLCLIFLSIFCTLCCLLTLCYVRCMCTLQ